MFETKPPNRLIRFLLLLSILCVVIVLLMKTQTTTLSGPFELEASEQWIVRQDRPGEIVTRHTLGRRQAMHGMRVCRFPDEDIVTVTLASNLTEGSWVLARTPILKLFSMTDSANEQIFAARVRRLREQTNLFHDGELQALHDESLSQLALAQTNLASFTPIVERRRGLVAQGILSADELQLTEDEYFRRRQNVEVARASVHVRRMQVAPSVIAMSEAELEEAEGELALVRARLAEQWLVTPIAGRITRSSGDPDLLLRVVSEDNLVARIVVPIAFMDKVHVGDEVKLTFSGHETLSATSAVAQVLVQPVPILGQSVLHLLVPLRNTSGKLKVAMTGHAVLYSVEINPLQILWRRALSSLRKTSRKTEEQQ